MSEKQKVAVDKSRLNKVGGEAVLEGVMMKSGEHVCLSVRAEDGSIKTQNSEHIPLRKKHKIFNIPVLRGVVNFIESMSLSFKMINDSVTLLGIEEEETKFEKWLREKFGASLMAVLTPISAILGIALSLFLFFFLPTFLTGLLTKLTGELGIWKSVIEGALKIMIFVAYLLLVSLMPDIKRTFQYHGAEHKSIFCFESGEELTVENVKKQRRFHPRCGTSFMFVMLLLGIFAGIFISWDNVLIRVLLRLAVFPLIIGVGYELLMFSGKHSGNIIVKILTAPGLWMQRITTKEPDDSQMEVAIRSLKGAMPEIFPPETLTNDNGNTAPEAGSDTPDEENKVADDK